MPGAIVKIARNFQVTVPKYVRESLGVKIGDLVSFEMKPDGQTVITPLTMVKKGQSYYFSEKWQNELAESEKELDKGHFKTFKTVKDLKKHIGDL
jgi:AbrB family looped-hinge helix DNA binding protein